MSELSLQVDRSFRFLALATIAVAGTLVYSNTFGVPFVFDDIGNISRNMSIRTLWPVNFLGSPRPVADYSFAINYAIHGLDLWGYHATNLLIHIAAGLCLFGIASRTFARGSSGSLRRHAGLAGLMVALLWVVHPLQTQAVTYLVQRHESLMGLAYLLTLYCFIRAQDSVSPTVWYLASIASCALGMGCKPVMISAPLIILWYDRSLIAASWSELWSRRRIYYLALFSTWLILARLMIGTFTTAQERASKDLEGDVIVVMQTTPLTYLQSQADVICHYLRLCFWPVGQILDFGRWPTAYSAFDIWPQAVVIYSLLGLTIWAMFRGSALSLLGGWFFLILAPTSSIIPINDYMFEHRMYLPLAAVIAAVVIAAFWLLDWFRLSPAQVARLAGSLMLVLAIVLGAVAFQRNTTWATDYRLWTDNVTKRPANARGHLHLRRATNRIHLEAAYAFLCGDTERAANICATAIAENPDQLGRFANLAALAADKLGHPEDALLLWWKALELDPRSLDARLELARRLAPTDREQALNHLRIALRQSPSSPQVQEELDKLRQ